MLAPSNESLFALHRMPSVWCTPSHFFFFFTFFHLHISSILPHRRALFGALASAALSKLDPEARQGDPEAGINASVAQTPSVEGGERSAGEAAWFPAVAALSPGDCAAILGCQDTMGLVLPPSLRDALLTRATELLRRAARGVMASREAAAGVAEARKGVATSQDVGTAEGWRVGEQGGGEGETGHGGESGSEEEGAVLHGVESGKEGREPAYGHETVLRRTAWPPWRAESRGSKLRGGMSLGQKQMRGEAVMLCDLVAYVRALCHGDTAAAAAAMGGWEVATDMITLARSPLPFSVAEAMLRCAAFESSP